MFVFPFDIENFRSIKLFQFLNFVFYCLCRPSSCAYAVITFISCYDSFMLCRLDSVSLTEFAIVTGKLVLTRIVSGVSLVLTSSIGKVRLPLPLSGQIQ